VNASEGIHQETILNLLVLAGEKCQRIMNAKIRNIPVKDVEADELWAFVQCKNRHKLHNEIENPFVGDAYTYVGIERNTKLVLAWHLGQRDMVHTELFTEKLSLRYCRTLSTDYRWLSALPRSR
jgi:hypothetical protein